MQGSNLSPNSPLLTTVRPPLPCFTGPIGVGIGASPRGNGPGITPVWRAIRPPPEIPTDRSLHGYAIDFPPLSAAALSSTLIDFWRDLGALAVNPSGRDNMKAVFTSHEARNRVLSLSPWWIGDYLVHLAIIPFPENRKKGLLPPLAIWIQMRDIAEDCFNVDIISAAAANVGHVLDTQLHSRNMGISSNSARLNVLLNINKSVFLSTPICNSRGEISNINVFYEALFICTNCGKLSHEAEFCGLYEHPPDSIVLPNLGIGSPNFFTLALTEPFRTPCFKTQTLPQHGCTQTSVSTPLHTLNATNTIQISDEDFVNTFIISPVNSDGKGSPISVSSNPVRLPNQLAFPKPEGDVNPRDHGLGQTIVLENPSSAQPIPNPIPHNQPTRKVLNAAKGTEAGPSSGRQHLVVGDFLINFEEKKGESEGSSKVMRSEKSNSSKKKGKGVCSAMSEANKNSLSRRKSVGCQVNEEVLLGPRKDVLIPQSVPSKEDSAVPKNWMQPLQKEDGGIKLNNIMSKAVEGGTGAPALTGLNEVKQLEQRKESCLELREGMNCEEGKGRSMMGIKEVDLEANGHEQLIRVVADGEADQAMKGDNKVEKDLGEECFKNMHDPAVMSFLSQIRENLVPNNAGHHVFNINSVNIYNGRFDSSEGSYHTKNDLGPKKDAQGNLVTVGEGGEGSSLSRKRMHMAPPMDQPSPLDSFCFALNSLLSQSNTPKDQFEIFWEEMKARYIQIFGYPVNDPLATPAAQNKHEAPASKNPQEYKGSV